MFVFCRSLSIAPSAQYIDDTHSYVQFCLRERVREPTFRFAICLFGRAFIGTKKYFTFLEEKKEDAILSIECGVAIATITDGNGRSAPVRLRFYLNEGATREVVGT